jgi:hypothetical protein
LIYFGIINLRDLMVKMLEDWNIDMGGDGGG